MRLEKVIDKALEQVGYDRYKLSLAVSKRVEELFKGDTPLVEADKRKMKLTDIALMEIAEGKIKLERIE